MQRLKRKTGRIEVRQRCLEGLQEHLRILEVGVSWFLLITVNHDPVSRLITNLLDHHAEPVGIIRGHISASRLEWMNKADRLTLEGWTAAPQWITARAFTLVGRRRVGCDLYHSGSEGKIIIRVDLESTAVHLSVDRAFVLRL